jgi:hypothetical protein
VVQPAAVVVQAEEERARKRPVGKHAEASDDAVGGLLVLHLDHLPAPRDVRKVAMLGDDAVDARALEALEPPLRDRRVVGDRRQAKSPASVSEKLLEPAPPLGERRLPEVVAAEGDEVEGDERRGRLGAETRDARRRGVEPREERLEVEAAVVDDDELAVEDDVGGAAQLAERVHDLGEVPCERPLVAASEVDVLPVPERETAEAVPFRLVEEPVERQLAGEAGQHGLDRRDDAIAHGARVPVRGGAESRGSPAARRRGPAAVRPSRTAAAQAEGRGRGRRSAPRSAA